MFFFFYLEQSFIYLIILFERQKRLGKRILYVHVSNDVEVVTDFSPTQTAEYKKENNKKYDNPQKKNLKKNANDKVQKYQLHCIAQQASERMVITDV